MTQRVKRAERHRRQLEEAYRQVDAAADDVAQCFRVVVALTMRAEKAEAEVARLKAEIGMLRGDDCGDNGDGPCGACRKCMLAFAPTMDRMRVALEAISMSKYPANRLIDIARQALRTNDGTIPGPEMGPETSEPSNPEIRNDSKSRAGEGI